MSDSKIILKSRLSEVLETLNIIILLYGIFIFIFGIILHNSEAILQACIMFVVYIIFEYINYDFIKITNKGITCKKYGFLSWNDMYIIKKKDRILYIYTKKMKKPYKFVIKKVEDKIEIERAYKYILSKAKDPKQDNVVTDIVL